MLMGPSDDILVAGMSAGEEYMGSWLSSAFNKIRNISPVRIPTSNLKKKMNAALHYMPTSMLYRAARGQRVFGDEEPIEYYGSWLSDTFNKVKTAVTGGTLSIGPQGLSLTKPPPAPLPSAAPGGAAGGIMSYVQRNPLPVAAGAALVLFLVLKKKK